MTESKEKVKITDRDLEKSRLKLEELRKTDPRSYELKMDRFMDRLANLTIRRIKEIARSK